ncbi:hypothetical protein BS78_06G118900, partial [Paspalum vaginatum]
MAGKALAFAILFSFVISQRGIRDELEFKLIQYIRGGRAWEHCNDDDYGCMYTVYVDTGSIWKAGTDAATGLGLRAADGAGFTIPDLARWGGLMGAGHDYYKRGSVDAFSGRAPCRPSPPCRMNLTSDDGSGPHHGWYCRSVQVTATGRHARCAGAEQWLARDAPPYQLYAARGVCATSDAEE